MLNLLHKIHRAAGHWLAGEEIVFDKKLTFKDIGNTLFTLNGSWLVRLKTGLSSSFRFRDNVKGIDYLTIDTLEDKAFITNPIKRIAFADSPYTAKWGEDIRVDTTGGDVTVNFPTVIGNNGKTIILGMEAKAGGTKIVLAPFGAETIEMSGAYQMTSLYSSHNFVSNGINLIRR